MPEQIETETKVTLTFSGFGMKISQIAIITRAKVPNMSAADFENHAKVAKEHYPVSTALLAVPSTLRAELITD